MVHSQLTCPLVLLCSLLMLPSVLMQGVGIDGGPKPIPVTNEEVKQAPAVAIEQYNECNYNSSFYFKELRIVKAETQMVVSLRYYLTVEVGKTVCNKRIEPLPFSKIQKCELPPLEEKHTCNFQVSYHPFQKGIQLLSMSCSPAKSNTGKGS